jgi:hypothetical protein
LGFVWRWKIEKCLRVDANDRVVVNRLTAVFGMRRRCVRGPSVLNVSAPGDDERPVLRLPAEKPKHVELKVWGKENLDVVEPNDACGAVRLRVVD